MKHTYNSRTVQQAFRADHFILEVDPTDETVNLLEGTVPDRSNPYLEIWNPKGSRKGSVRVQGLSRLSNTLFDVLKTLRDFHQKIELYELHFALPEQPFVPQGNVSQFFRDRKVGPRGQYKLYFGSSDMTAQNHPSGTLLHANPGEAAAHAMEVAHGFGIPYVHCVNLKDRGELAPPPEFVAERGGAATVEEALEHGTVLLRGAVPREAIEEVWAMRDGQWHTDKGDTPAQRLKMEGGWLPQAQLGVLLFDDPQTPLPPVIVEEIEKIAESLDRTRSADEWITQQYDGQSARRRAAFLRVVFQLANQPAKIDLNDPRLDYPATQKAWEEYHRLYHPHNLPHHEADRNRTGYTAEGHASTAGSMPPPRRHPTTGHLDHRPYSQQRPPAQRIATAPEQRYEPFLEQRYERYEAQRSAPASPPIVVFYPMDTAVPPVIEVPARTIIAPLMHIPGEGFSTMDENGDPQPIDLQAGTLMVPALWDQGQMERVAVLGERSPRKLGQEAKEFGITVTRDRTGRLVAVRGDGEQFGGRAVPNRDDHYTSDPEHERWGAYL